MTATLDKGPAPVEPGDRGPSRLASLAWASVPYVVAISAAFVVAGIVVALLGNSPAQAFEAVVTTSFRTPLGLRETFHKWVPLTLQALAFAIPLAAGRFNIGGEGQLLLGASGAAAVGILFADLPMPVLLPMVLVAGVLAGGVWAAIAAWLMVRFGVNEILSTVLLNFVSFAVVDYIASEIWADPGAGFAASIRIGAGGELPGIGRPPMHLGVLIALVVAVCTAVVVRRSAAGYELRAVGANERAARVHGVRTARVAAGALVVGGLLAGLSGAIEVAGVQGKLIEGIGSNYLLLGIIIGLIARGNVVAVPFVAFGIAVLEVGASAMQRRAEVPSELVLIVEALILIFLLLSDVLASRLRRRL